MNDFHVLEAIRSEIQAEHNLISHRLTWYTTAQSFLLTAYAVALAENHSWPIFFVHALPILGILLSILAEIGVVCAISVQYTDIKLQTDTLAASEQEAAARGDKEFERLLLAYRSITCAGRPTGKLPHWLAMLGPLTIPLLFFFAWAIAYVLKH